MGYVPLENRVRSLSFFFSSSPGIFVANYRAVEKNKELHGGQIAAVGPVDITPKKFENRGFTMKLHQIVSIRTMLEKFKNTTITGHYEFVFEVNS